MRPWRQFHLDAYGTSTTGYLLVGEAPGYRSWANRRRFTGPAGWLIRRALARVGNPRYPDLESLFYLTDAVKCHPGAKHNERANRSPRRAEAAACLGHLVRELQALRPSVIVTFGNAAAEAVRRALPLAAEGAGPRPKPTLIAFPHPSPRNQQTIRKYYPSIEAFERDIARTFRLLIKRLKRAVVHA